jgi:hypothetical protein
METMEQTSRGSLVTGLVAAFGFAALVVLGLLVVPDAERGLWIAVASSVTAFVGGLGLALHLADHRRTFLGFVVGLAGSWAVVVSWVLLTVSSS